MLPPHYRLKNISKVIDDPSHLKWEYYRLKQKYIHGSSKFATQLRHEGVDVANKDWDNLLIMDALRYDYLDGHPITQQINGEFESVVSQGCNTIEFLRKNFEGREMYDTVYVTANPQITRLNGTIFHDIINVYKSWDEETGTVLPEMVVKAASKANKQYPNKRLLVHFMQPHAPFIGRTGMEIREEYEIIGWLEKRNNNSARGQRMTFAAKEGVIPPTKFEQAYRENVNIVLKNARDLIKELTGKTVLTSDHGEFVGERILLRRRFGHGCIHHPILTTVPWFVINSGGRKNTYSEDPVKINEVDQEIISDRLKMLGYRE